MAGVLIATAPKYQEALRNIFAPENGTCQICGNAGQARRALGEGQAELLVVNAPLPDEFGRDLAVQAADGRQVWRGRQAEAGLGRRNGRHIGH